ncbi:hypothetical protein EYF80_001231 [Liparis tanakae]|uniref:Uncharacterized protein n=1 Tax=Liparis tanakae TaxID=230148 RepID=A0A4Z2JDZ9_9TELE|nr:hypothetical protein EYF80_001231 [Liparis tanakae]
MEEHSMPPCLPDTRSVTAAEIPQPVSTRRKLTSDGYLNDPRDIHTDRGGAANWEGGCIRSLCEVGELQSAPWYAKSSCTQPRAVEFCQVKWRPRTLSDYRGRDSDSDCQGLQPDTGVIIWKRGWEEETSVELIILTRASGEETGERDGDTDSKREERKVVMEE